MFCLFVKLLQKSIHVLLGGHHGGVHHLLRGEGGKQGDPLMPIVQSWTTCGIGGHLREVDGERLLAFLDDLYVVLTPKRTVAVHNILREMLWQHAKVRRFGRNSNGFSRGSHEDRPEDQGIPSWHTSGVARIR